MTTTPERRRRKLIPEMEGRQARWYARLRGTDSQLAEYRRQAAVLTEALPEHVDVLEVAPGPGYLSLELARRGHRVTGLDISHTFVELATDRARGQGLDVRFQQGDASAMPLPDASFDLIVCQAAFKNFALPVRALDEMHRVLRPGGSAVIEDMWGEATAADIRAEVERMNLSRFDGFMTRRTLTWLRRRAYTREKFAQLAAASAFGQARITTEGIGITVRLTRS
ncbi:class I SAM-dependent methyltransferase [Catellatospora tritici]|uniref:class I SAM-dependent methyltransferase n=1 Tax=Catellatospora tritici TaxID=2851566 RepID=UPI001C2CE7FB|nr:class I SAM-dependent methyltransferase [Catellatospora tritici]MBV1856604.1 class I SAM-dependent methyltransferase [Catellatospora tritici]